MRFLTLPLLFLSWYAVASPAGYFLPPNTARKISPLIENGVLRAVIPPGFDLKAVQIQKDRVVLVTDPPCQVVMTRTMGTYKTRWFGVTVQCIECTPTNEAKSTLYTLGMIVDSGFSNSPWIKYSPPPKPQKKDIGSTSFPWIEYLSSKARNGNIEFVPRWFTFSCAILTVILILIRKALYMLC
jgi:hypothetical protein